MYRNMYVEAYKNSIHNEMNLEVMLCHVHHIYAALGCVIQDIEFMVGNILAGKEEKKMYKPRMSLPQRIPTLDKPQIPLPEIGQLPSSNFKLHQIPRPKSKAQEPQSDSQDHNFLSAIMLEQELGNNSHHQPVSEKNKSQPQQNDDFLNYIFKKKKKMNN